MKTPEGRVKDEIRKWLKEQGAYVFSPVQTGMGSRTLDLLVCWNGQFVAVEVKRPGGKPTKLQVEIAKRMIEAGGIPVCTDSLDYLKQQLPRWPKL